MLFRRIFVLFRRRHDQADPSDGGAGIAVIPAGQPVIAVVDGRQPGYSLGATGAEICDIMRAEGCTDVVNMDGGGSSSLVVFDHKRGEPKMLNRHKGGAVRKVAVNFGIMFQDGSTEP